MDHFTLLFTFILLAVYQLKHFICDFPLQGKYMLGKFKPGWEFLGPLAAHSAVHGAATFAIVVLMCGRKDLAWLAAFDFVVHFTMDRIKAGPKYLGRFKDMYDKKFWWSLGLDQMVHHFTHYVIIWNLVAA